MCSDFIHDSVLQRLPAVSGQVLKYLRTAEVACHDDHTILERHHVALRMEGGAAAR